MKFIDQLKKDVAAWEVVYKSLTAEERKEYGLACTSLSTVDNDFLLYKDVSKRLGTTRLLLGIATAINIEVSVLRKALLKVSLSDSNELLKQIDNLMEQRDHILFTAKGRAR